MLNSSNTRIPKLAFKRQVRIIHVMLAGTLALAVGLLLPVVSFIILVSSDLDLVAVLMIMLPLTLAIMVGNILNFDRLHYDYYGEGTLSRIKNILKAASGEEFCDEVIGDLEEVFLREREVLGDFRARMRLRRALLSVMLRRCGRLVLQFGLRERG
jgi:hypothetical protein